ncbi:MAG: efflux RND transporter permease subunit [Desulfosarcina sp.]|nr:efflux RND transporter permease subunit [Desulfobacterales bacterium]
MRAPIAWFAENYVAANLLMAFILVTGVWTGITMKLEIFPETTLDLIRITAIYSGASPSEVEEGVVRKIEEQVAGLAGIKRIDSTSREGVGTVTIEVMKDWDLKQLLDEVKSEVDQLTTLPDEAEKPVIREITRRREVIDLAIYGDAPEATIKHLAERIRDDIINLPGITLADIEGVRDAEIHIEISEDTLRRYGLTLGQVADLVRQGSLDLPAGSVKTAAGEILIRTKGRRYYAEDYGDIAIITRPDGSKVSLADMAILRDGFEEVDRFARFQGKPAALINVYRVADQNALEVAGAVKAYVERIRPSLPEGIGISLRRDRSQILRSRIELLTRNLLIGLVLVGVMLGLFLNIGLAFWVMLGIPISFAFGLLLLPRLDVSINMISLFAFIMVLGIVVDDAIIVGENVFRRYESGDKPLRGAVEGTLEVGHPVIFAVLTTIVAFWPLLLAGGVMGKFMRNIPIVVIVVLLGSLVESLFILPSHLMHSRRAMALSPTGRMKEKRASRWLRYIVNGPYARLVDFCLHWRYATIAVGVAVILMAVGLWQGGWIKFTFMPKVEGDTIRAYITMPVGTPVRQTLQVVSRLELDALAVFKQYETERSDAAPPLLEHIMIQIGRHSGATGSHLGQIRIQMLEGEQRDVSTFDITRSWRRKIGTVPEAEAVTFRSSLHRAGNPIEVHLSLDDDVKLIQAADELKSVIARIPGVFDIEDSFLQGKQELQLKLKPAASNLGLTLNDLARQVRHAFYGAEALRIQRDKDEVKVKVRYPESERRSLGNVEDMYIRTPDGSEVPFKQVAEVQMHEGYAKIERAQRLRIIKVTADVDEDLANANEIRLNLGNEALPQLVNRFPGLRYTIEGEGKEQRESLADVKNGSVIALFGIYALLAIPFRSFSQPLIVMAAIPFGIVGAMVGHLIMGFNLSIISIFGIVGLSGVVVNDSLVLIHRANRFRQEGLNSHDAVIRAGCIRFRAILLTSLTTFAGLSPMLVEKGIQAQFLIPMAVSLGFGVLFATVITLLLIPCGYMILEDFHRLAGRRQTTPAASSRPQAGSSAT